MSKNINIAIFASGNGSNAENIFNYFKDHATISIKKLFCNNPRAHVLERAKKCNLETFVFSKDSFQDFHFLGHLSDIDYIVLAGFLWLLPPHLVHKFENKIFNIHPSLLPKYGGKGMYGKQVHYQVIKNCETTSGMTIHLVNEEYDRGKILFQKSCPVYHDDNIKKLTARISVLEHMHYPRVIEKEILDGWEEN